MPRRPPPGTRPWTPAEDAILRARYVRDGSEAVAGATGRTVHAVHHRANALGLLRKRRWTRRDDNQLRDLWESGRTLEAIARELDRTPLTTYWRAQKLGLQLGVPQGNEYLTQAALRTGYIATQLRKILRWARVPIRPVLSRPKPGRCRTYHYIDPMAVDEAVKRWLDTEPVEAAARRHELGGDTLRRWLVEAEIRPPRGRRARAHWRVPSADIERVIAERRKVVSLAEAARRIGVHRDTLARRLRGAGHAARGRRWFVRVEEAQRVVAAVGAPDRRWRRGAR